MSERIYLAVDIGASSGRHVAGLFDGGALRLEEIHRFDNGGVAVLGRLHWDVLAQWRHVLDGLKAAAARFERVQSIGVDTWGVDFALLGEGDELLGNPYHYRDRRTEGTLARATKIVPREEIFAETGLQFMEISTLYQLLAMRETDSPLLAAARRFLMMPDLFHWMLTGEKSNERTNASTTQLYNPIAGDWSASLIERFGLPREIFGPLAEPGTRLGPLVPQVIGETGLHGAIVVLPGTHDTASAVAAVPAMGEPRQQPDWCYISSGTWSLMGVETPRPVIDSRCLSLNFTNEAGVGGTTRLLKNIAGMWLAQECRRVWASEGKHHSWDELTRLAEAAPPLASLVNPDDDAFIAPENMPELIRQKCRRAGDPAPETPGATFRCILESLALRYRQVLGFLETLSGGVIGTIHIVGGGSKNRLLCQMTADACARPVVAGPVEATAIGNLAVQLIADGQLRSLADARSVVAKSFAIERFEPRETQPWDEAFAAVLRVSPMPEGT